MVQNNYGSFAKKGCYFKFKGDGFNLKYCIYLQKGTAVVQTYLKKTTHKINWLSSICKGFQRGRLLVTVEECYDDVQRSSYEN